MRVNPSTKCVVPLAIILAGVSALLLGGPGAARAMDEKAGAAERAAVGQNPPAATDQPTGSVASSNPVSGKPEAIAAGRKLYSMWCTQCHGPHADGVSRFGKYAADLRQFWRGYREFVTIVKNGRTDRQMPPWKEVLDDKQISQVGSFLETLAMDGANWK